MADRTERAKAQLFEFLKLEVERSIWELYTLCEYDANAARTAQTSDLLRAGAEDFAKVRARPR